MSSRPSHSEGSGLCSSLYMLLFDMLQLLYISHVSPNVCCDNTDYKFTLHCFLLVANNLRQGLSQLDRSIAIIVNSGV